MREQDNSPLAVIDIVSELSRVQMLPGEDPNLFEQLRTRILADVKTRDVIEELLVADIIVHTWQLVRHRRFRDNVLALGDETTRALFSAESGSDADHSASNVPRPHLLIMGEASEAMTVEFADSLKNKLHLLDRLTDLIEREQAGRAMALRELDRHRETLARRAQETVAQIEDAEFRTLEDRGDARLRSCEADETRLTS